MKTLLKKKSNPKKKVLSNTSLQRLISMNKRLYYSLNQNQEEYL